MAAHQQLRGSQFLQLPLLEWLLYLYTVTSPFFIFAVVTTRDTVSFWVVVLMTLLVLCETVRRGGQFVVDRTLLYLGFLLGAYGLVTLALYLEGPSLTVLGRGQVERALTVDLRLLFVVVAYAVFLQCLAGAREEVFRRILRIQLGLGAVLAAFGILQYVMFAAFDSTTLAAIKPSNEAFALRSFLLKVGRERVFRSMSVFSEPSFFGFFLIPLFVKTLAAWFLRVEIWPPWVLRGLALLFGIAILTNFSLTAIVACAILGMIVLAVAVWKVPRIAVSVFLVAVLFVSLASLTPAGAAVVERVGQVAAFRDLSTLDRLLRAYTGFLVFLEHPLAGVGPGGYAFWYPQMGGLDRSVMVTPLNIWVSFLTDVGVLGAIPFLAFIVAVLRRGLRARTTKPLAAVFLWSTVSYLVLLTTLDFWFLEVVWFEFALLVTLCSPLRGQVELLGTEPATASA